MKEKRQKKTEKRRALAVRGEVQYISNILIINISFKKILIRITRRITKNNLCYFFAEIKLLK